MITSKEIRISTDGQIFLNGASVGFTEDGTVFIFTRNGTVPLGAFDHKSEVVAMVLEWFNKR